MIAEPLVCKCGQFTRKMWKDGQYQRECIRAAGHVVAPLVVVELRFIDPKPRRRRSTNKSGQWFYVLSLREQGQTFQEIAEQTGYTVGTVKTYISNARQIRAEALKGVAA